MRWDCTGIRVVSSRTSGLLRKIHCTAVKQKEIRNQKFMKHNRFLLASTSTRPGVIDVKFPRSEYPRYSSVNWAANSPVGSSISAQ